MVLLTAYAHLFEAVGPDLLLQHRQHGFLHRTRHTTVSNHTGYKHGPFTPSNVLALLAKCHFLASEVVSL